MGNKQTEFEAYTSQNNKDIKAYEPKCIITDDSYRYMRIMKSNFITDQYLLDQYKYNDQKMKQMQNDIDTMKATLNRLDIMLNELHKAHEVKSILDLADQVSKLQT